MKSLYIRCARFGSNKDEWMSTQTEWCFSRKSSGSSVYGIRWNHIRRMIGLPRWGDYRPVGRQTRRFVKLDAAACFAFASVKMDRKPWHPTENPTGHRIGL